MDHGKPSRTKKRSAPAMARRAKKISARRSKSALASLSAGENQPSPQAERVLSPRGRATLSAATAAGYLRGEKTERIGGRVTRKLLSEAQKKSGLTSQTELLEYALSKVALEDDYGATLLSMKGSVPDDVEL